MKNRRMPTRTAVLLVIGLLLVSVAPLLSRYWHLSDFVKGLLTGLGLGMELIALILILRNRRKVRA